MDPGKFKRLLKTPLLAVVMAFLLAVSISIMYPGTEVDPEKVLKQSVLIFLSACVIGRYVSANAPLFGKVLILAVFAVAVVAVFHLYEFYLVEDHAFSARLEGYFLAKNPLHLAGLFGCFFVASVYMAIEYSARPLVVLLMVLTGCMLLTAALATQSRSFFVAVLVAIMLPYCRKGWKALLVILLLVLLGVLIAVYIQPNLLDRTELPRLRIWKYSLELIGQKPIFGWGSEYEPIIKVTALTLVETHNMYLTVWLKYGVLAFAALVALAGYATFLVMVNPDNRTLRLGGALFVFGATMMFFEGHDIIARPNRLWLMLWIPLGIMLGALQLRTRTSEDAHTTGV
jgi:O-antigen ligase